MAVDHLRKLGSADVGTTVQVEVSDADRGPFDFRFILAYIVEIDEVRSTYRLCTKHGMIKGWRSRNEFVICKTDILKESDLNRAIELSIRTASGLDNLSGGQGIVKCNCKGTCAGGRCKCKAANIPCNSKCHNGPNTNCKNKA